MKGLVPAVPKHPLHLLPLSPHPPPSALWTGSRALSPLDVYHFPSVVTPRLRESPASVMNLPGVILPALQRQAVCLCRVLPRHTMTDVAGSSFPGSSARRRMSCFQIGALVTSVTVV